MLNSVNIQNFRLFDKFSMDGLARVNLIVGKNNVGKSSLLEALYLLVNQNDPRVLFELLKIRGEIYPSPNNALKLRYKAKHLFPGHLENDVTIQINSGDDDSLKLEIEFLKSYVQSNIRLQGQINSEVLKVKYGDSGREINLDMSGGEVDSQGNKMLITIPSPHQRTVANYITTKGANYDGLARAWDNITLTPKEDNVIEMLRILEPDMERISFTSHQSPLVRCKGQDTPVPLGSMGEGMYRMLIISMALANSEGGYLFVDEIDTGLHYRTITDMWDLVFKTAERLNVQVFATTHSLDCIRSFNEALHLQEDKTVGKLFRLGRRVEGNIVAVEYDTDDLTIAVRQDIEVR